LGSLVEGAYRPGGILAFAEHLIANLAVIWLDADLRQRQAIQRAVFPAGLACDGQQFGTAATCLFFNRLQNMSRGPNDVASRIFASSNQLKG
jgi:hypothetical protein